MILDLYHAQIGEGNLIELLERAKSLIGEVQVADVPGRCEPGTGEINYSAIAAALKKIGYRGTWDSRHMSRPRTMSPFSGSLQPSVLARRRKASPNGYRNSS